jgi:hypothetical protein
MTAAPAPPGCASCPAQPRTRCWNRGKTCLDTAGAKRPTCRVVKVDSATLTWTEGRLPWRFVSRPRGCPAGWRRPGDRRDGSAEHRAIRPGRPVAASVRQRATARGSSPFSVAGHPGPAYASSVMDRDQSDADASFASTAAFTNVSAPPSGLPAPAWNGPGCSSPRATRRGRPGPGAWPRQS